MKPSTAYLTLYTSIFLLSLNGLFSNSLPLDATTITQVRSLFAAVTLLIFIFATKGSLKLNDRKAMLTVYGLGVLMGMHWMTFFYAMQTASVAIGMLALYTYPIMTVFIEPFFTQKKLKRLDIILTIGVMIGLTIIVSGHLGSTQHNTFIGVLSGVISAALFTLRNTIQKYHCPHIPSDTLMLHQLLAISIMLILFIDVESLTTLPSNIWGHMIILGVLTTAIAHTLLVKSYKLFDAKTVAMISCLQPVLGSLFAWLVLSEQLQITTIIGGTIILAVAAYESAKAST